MHDDAAQDAEEPPAFHDFEQFERLVEASRTDRQAHLVVLAGRRGGSPMRRDHGARVDLRQFAEAATMRAAVGVEGPRDDAEGRPEPVRAAHEAIDGGAPGREAPTRASVSLRCVWQVAHAEGRAGDGAAGRTAGERQAGASHPASHVLLAPGDARRAGKSDSGARRSPGPVDHAAVHAPEPCGARRGDQVVGWSG